MKKDKRDVKLCPLCELGHKPTKIVYTDKGQQLLKGSSFLADLNCHLEDHK